MTAANTAYQITEWTFGWELMRQTTKQARGTKGEQGQSMERVKKRSFFRLYIISKFELSHSLPMADSTSGTRKHRISM